MKNPLYEMLGYRRWISGLSWGGRKSRTTKTFERMQKTERGRRQLLNRERIEKELDNLEEMGFLVVPLTNVLPDIVAYKDGKMYAIEVQWRPRADFKKYEESLIGKYIEEVLWIFRGEAALRQKKAVPNFHRKLENSDKT